MAHRQTIYHDLIKKKEKLFINKMADKDSPAAQKWSPNDQVNCQQIIPSHRSYHNIKQTFCLNCFHKALIE